MRVTCKSYKSIPWRSLKKFLHDQFWDMLPQVGLPRGSSNGSSRNDITRGTKHTIRAMRHGGGFHTCVIWIESRATGCVATIHTCVIWTESRATGQQIGSRWWQILTKEAYTSVHLAHLCTHTPCTQVCIRPKVTFKQVYTSVHPAQKFNVTNRNIWFLTLCTIELS